MGANRPCVAHLTKPEIMLDFRWSSCTIFKIYINDGFSIKKMVFEVLEEILIESV